MGTNRVGSGVPRNQPGPTAEKRNKDALALTESLIRHIDKKPDDPMLREPQEWRRVLVDLRDMLLG